VPGREEGGSGEGSGVTGEIRARTPFFNSGGKW
jgi:hypothetical protein